MNKQKFYPVLIFTTILVLVLVSFAGCISSDTFADNDSLNNSSDKNMDLNWLDNTTGDNSETNTTPFNASLKKTGVMELDNGYSFKVLEIDRHEGYIRASLRKDGNEYDIRTLMSGSTYKVKDTKNLNIIYTVTVDEILDNSFVVELSFQMKPEILLETGTYEDPVSKSELKISEDTIIRTYRWEYDETDFTVKYEYNTEAYDMYSERSRKRDYANFVNDPLDDDLISQITEQMGKLAIETGYSEKEIPYIAMAFVQSLPYVSDSISSGYDEYPRFPFETLYHGGGDCEDSSILLAALLDDMGYGVALIELPGHMAVGVKGDSNLGGSYYYYSGVRYYYLETTNSGWDVGVIPDEYADEEGIVVPIYDGYPEFNIVFSGTGEINKHDTYVDLDIEIENVGSSVAEDVVIYATLETTTEDMLWDDLKTDTDMNLEVEDKITYTVTDLYIPTGQKYRVGIWAWGSNTQAEYVYSDWTGN